MTIKQNNPLKNFYLNKIKPQLQRALDDIRHPGNHPHTTALSMALGIFIGIFIPMGLQVWTLTLLLLVMRFNILIATLVTFISNPFTILPIYYSGIFVGETIMNMPFPWQYFDKFIEEPKLDYLINFGSEGAIVFLSGLFVLGIIAAVITYLLSFRFAVFLQHKARTVLEQG
jgi:uncharacterized protein